MARQVPLLDRRLRWLTVVVIAGGILLASVVRPDGGGESLGPFRLVGLDKWFHLLGYTLLALALAYAFAEWESLWVPVTVFTVTVVFGFGVEFLQASIPYREFDWLDLLANAVGPLLVAITWTLAADRVRFYR